MKSDSYIIACRVYWYHDWKAIKYSTDKYHPDYFDGINGICVHTAHDVIGQEFEKAVFVMDKHFKYNDQGKLFPR